MEKPETESTFGASLVGLTGSEEWGLGRWDIGLSASGAVLVACEWG
jgi:hypothetical protein